MKQKKVPLRMCSGCREMKPKENLIRVVKNKEGEIFLDTTGKKNGRGAYLCHSEECFLKARKSRGFERAFQTKIEDALYDSMFEELKADE